MVYDIFIGCLWVLNLITRNISNKQRAELARYLVAGFSATGTDLAIYWILLPLVGPSPSKAISFILATCVAYMLNKYWTFKAMQHCWREMSRFGLLYGSSLLLNVAVNRLTISFIPLALPPLIGHEYQLGWFFATGFSAVYNFCGQKFWVFRPKSEAAG